MTMTISERLVNRVSRRGAGRPRSRRGFLGGAALVGAALAVDPWGFLVKPADAYATVCGSGAQCADGWSVFCCTINGGINSCPPNSFIGGWWKADASSFCGGSARYYIDCNAFAGSNWKCHCASGTCDSRRVACNQFRYGQCNLNIPWESTGPVVCRIISCTPPWQQFGGVCTSSSATDNATASHSAPCVGVPPRGYLDSAVQVGETIVAQGWAFDPDQPASALNVSVRVDGVAVNSTVSAVARPDVNLAFGITGIHGYRISVPVKPGRHTVAVFVTGIAGGPGSAEIASRVVVVAPPALPIGRIDSVTSAPGGFLRILGWALDRDQPATAIQVAVYLDGIGVRRFPTGVARPDVNKLYHVSGQHGFDITIKAALGAHQVAVYGINVGGGNGKPLLGIVIGTVIGTSPVGVLDSVVSDHGAAVLTGWAFDPDQPATPISVTIFRDGLEVGSYPTGVARPDVDRVYHVTGNHGFSIRIPSAPGSHEFVVFASNIAPAGASRAIGARTVVVTA